MIALQIQDIKFFTKALFLGETFDWFLVKEASIVTFNSFFIDGAIRQGYYSEEELEAGRIEQYSSWKLLRPFCFSLIKGNKLPESFSIILRLPPDQTERLLKERCASWSLEQVSGLYLNIRYENHTLTAVTGVALQQFTMDKTLEHEWDDMVQAFFKKHQIPFETV